MHLCWCETGRSCVSVCVWCQLRWQRQWSRFECACVCEMEWNGPCTIPGIECLTHKYTKLVLYSHLHFTKTLTQTQAQANTLHWIVKWIYFHLPPSFSSAIACALLFLLVTKHWYIPLSFLPTFLMAREVGVSNLILLCMYIGHKREMATEWWQPKEHPWKREENWCVCVCVWERKRMRMSKEEKSTKVKFIVSSNLINYFRMNHSL